MAKFVRVWCHCWRDLRFYSAITGRQSTSLYDVTTGLQTITAKFIVVIPPGRTTPRRMNGTQNSPSVENIKMCHYYYTFFSVDSVADNDAEYSYSFDIEKWKAPRFINWRLNVLLTAHLTYLPSFVIKVNEQLVSNKFMKTSIKNTICFR